MNNDTNSRATANVVIDLASFLAEILSFEQLKYWQADKKQPKKNLKDAFKMPLDEFAEMRLDWQAFYKKSLGWDLDFSQVFIPLRPNVSHRLEIIAKGLTCDTVYESWPFLKRKYMESSIDAAIPTNIRSASEHYAVWILDGAEPDTNFLGKSTKEVDADMKIGMTILERMLLEWKYLDETGKHLDVIGGTLCGGSRYADGYVPYVYLYRDGKVCVFWSHLSCSRPHYGVRQAVSS